MEKYLLITASILAALAVTMGAFGAHGIKPRVTAEQLHTFETAVKYQFYHAIAIFILGIIIEKTGSKIQIASAFSFFLGIVLFSGSLYLLATKHLLGIEHWSWLGPVTPIGGTLFIFGWVLLVISLIVSK